ncbi:MAG: dimethylargininase [Acidobacteria bacterium]|nr:MAG: dimethylargininase [Acidobacteriota bacterium]REK06175.1 MAG: dimethylargininase [Acidobacteriota bacterium]
MSADPAPRPAARLVALTRPVSASIGRCELTHLERRPIDVERARFQHRVYEERLRRLGCDVVALPTADELPDAVFVEDCAVVLDEVAVLTRPGVASRRPEVAAVEAALTGHRPLSHIAAPGTLDGGDVLHCGRRLFVGVGGRTNVDGLRQLADAVAPWQYSVEAVELSRCLHLKTAVTCVGEDTLLLDPRLIEAEPFRSRGFEVLETDAAEPGAANALEIGGQVLVSAAAPRTAERLRAHGLRVDTVVADELAKAEAGLTCCSILFRPGTIRPPAATEP